MIQTDYDEVMEPTREVLYKGCNRNANRLTDLKAKALSPPKANMASDLENILGDWRRHTRDDGRRGPEMTRRTSR